MDSQSKDFDQRRKVLTLLGTSAVALPVLGLAGCGGDQSAESSMSDAADSMEKAASDAASDMSDAAENAMESAEDSVNEAMDSAEDSMNDAMESAEAAADDAMDEAQTIAKDAAGDMPRVDENGSQAQAVAYVHEASAVDASAQPRYAEGQQCSNCALYQGGDAAWGACPLFGGQQVKATGWCNAYAPAA